MKKNLLFFSFLSSAMIQKYQKYRQNVKCFNDLKPNFQKPILNKETDLFIWGKGEAFSASDYSNFHPHRIRKFDGLDKHPSFIDITFGEQLAVAIDKKNGLYIWREPKLNPEKREGNSNHERKEIIQLPKKYKAIQAAITKNKIFFLTKEGSVYFINYKVSVPESKDSYFTIKSKEEIVSIQHEKIIHIKELKSIKSISVGKDHFIALDKNGELFGMGDDSYGIY